VPLFSEIDAFLRPLGFELYDLDVYRYPRRGSGVAPAYELDGAVGPGLAGQVVCSTSAIPSAATRSCRTRHF